MSFCFSVCTFGEIIFQNLPYEAFYWESGHVSDFESTALKSSVFNVISVLLFLHLASDICPQYTNNYKNWNSK